MWCRLLAVVGLVAAAGCGGVDGAAGGRDPEPYQEFVGRDLAALDDRAKGRLRELVAGLPPPTTAWGDRWDDIPSRHLFPHPLADGTLVLIHLAYGTSSIPGAACVTVRFLDPAGPQLAAAPFFAGWRTILDHAEYRLDPDFGPVIELTHNPKVRRPGENIADGRQVYAVAGLRLALLRIEDGKGALVYNSYGHPTWRHGPATPTRTAADWERMLESDDLAQALEALVWLGGNHKEEQTDPGFPESEDAAAVRFVEDVRRRPGVKAAVGRLTAHDHRWVSEAALLAQEREGK